MKKLFCLILALMMTLSLSAVAWGDSPLTVKESPSIPAHLRVRTGLNSKALPISAQCR